MSENDTRSHAQITTEAPPIESPNGLDLNPKPPNPIRMNKRAGALVLTVGIILLGLFAYGGYKRQRLQQNVVADFGTKNVTAATAAGSEILKAIPEGGTATVAGQPSAAVDPRTRPPAAERGAVAQASADRLAGPTSYQVPPASYSAANDGVRVASP